MCEIYTHTHTRREGREGHICHVLHSLYPALVFKQSYSWTHSPGLKKGVSHTAMKSCFLGVSESKAHKQFGCFTVFLISLYDLPVLFVIQPKPAGASFHHSLSALPHFSLSPSQWYLCRSPLFWSFTASCWRSGVQVRQLVSAQLRVMGSCRHFEENT